jgi:hypothetical protein
MPRTRKARILRESPRSRVNSKEIAELRRRLTVVEKENAEWIRLAERGAVLIRAYAVAKGIWKKRKRVRVVRRSMPDSD